jgi:hypothetical protein
LVPSSGRPWARANSSTNAITSARLSGGSDMNARINLKPSTSAERSFPDSIRPLSGDREKYATLVNRLDSAQPLCWNGGG